MESVTFCKYCGADVPGGGVCVGCLMVLGTLAYEENLYAKEEVMEKRKVLASSNVDFDPPSLVNRG